MYQSIPGRTFALAIVSALSFTTIKGLRLAAMATFGVALLLPGLTNPTKAGETPPGTDDQLTGPRRTGHFVTIQNNLGHNQEYERVEIYISGNFAGEFALDKQRRTAQLRIPLTGKSERYFVRGTEASERDGRIVVSEIAGEGTIDLSVVATYSLYATQYAGGKLYIEPRKSSD